MALSIISQYLLEVELTIGDEFETFYKINYKNYEVLIFTLF